MYINSYTLLTEKRVILSLHLLEAIGNQPRYDL